MQTHWHDVQKLINFIHNVDIAKSFGGKSTSSEVLRAFVHNLFLLLYRVRAPSISYPSSLGYGFPLCNVMQKVLMSDNMPKPSVLPV